MWQQILVAVLAAFVLTAAVTGDTLVLRQGESTNNTRLIQTVLFRNEAFHSVSQNISVIEVYSLLPEANNSTIRVIGGINQNFVYVSSPFSNGTNTTGNLYYLLSIYTEVRDIRDISEGVIEPNSRLLFSERFTQTSNFGSLSEIISAFVILDHSPVGDFTRFEWTGGVGHTFLSVRAFGTNTNSSFELQVYAQPRPLTIDRNNTIFVGDNYNSDQIHSELINDQLIFVGTEKISAFEIIDLTARNKGIVEWFGGIGYDYLFVVSPNFLVGNSSTADYQVNIYAERSSVIVPPERPPPIDGGNGLFVGELNDHSYAIHTEYFDEYLTFFGMDNITAFQVEDRSNGTSVQLSWLGGIGANFLFLAPAITMSPLKSVEDDYTSHYFVTIYSEKEVEPPTERPPNHFFTGESTADSVLIYSQHLSRADLFLDTYEVSTNSVNVTRVELWDNTVGTGAQVLAVQIAWWRRVVTTVFEPFGEVDFQLRVYGERPRF